MTVDPAFWRGRRVLLTGNTGFKGAWLSLWLSELGADVRGVSAGRLDGPSLHEQARLDELVSWQRVDIRDGERLTAAVRDSAPEVLIHLAAQSLVRRSLAAPAETFETNVLGTLNVLEAARRQRELRVVINVTSDKCYENAGLRRAFREDDPLGGKDPYSASKACAELVAHAYASSLLPDGPRLASVRAGNVIGGGDWGADRLLPDLMRAALAERVAAIRNPDATRPWQHVLNPLSGYLTLAQRLWEDATLTGGWNFGPGTGEAVSVGELVARVAERWPRELRWERDAAVNPPEAPTLMLDSGKARERLGWRPAWGLDEGLAATVDWYAAVAGGEDARALTLEQAASFAGVRA